MLAPYRKAKFEAHTGPFLFEFQRHGMPTEGFVGKLDRFFAQLPKNFRYAIEIRNAGLLGPHYRSLPRTAWRRILGRLAEKYPAGP